MEKETPHYTGFKFAINAEIVFFLTTIIHS